MIHATPPAHPRTIGWIGTTALAMGGSNLSLLVFSALLIGQGSIPGQGTAAIPLLFLGLVLSWMALPGWTELVMMYPNRVGGIAASCAEAFRPYNPVLANLTGVCYWWGWVPVSGMSAILAATAIHDWYLPGIPVTALAVGIVLFFTAVSLCGIKSVTMLAIPIATASAALAFLSVILPIWAGTVDWQQATNFKLTTPFPGWFGALTSSMAGLYLIGFTAPAFETAACHVGEMIDYKKSVPRAMFASAGMASLFCVFIPLVWLGVLGSEAMSRDLAVELGPVFAPLFGASARAAAVWFVIFNMFSGTLTPVASAARALSQLGEDGLLPEIFSKRLKRTDAPWFATVFTAALALVFLLMGDPLWLIAACNMTYLIGISLPSVAVWLLRRNAPNAERPYRAPRGMIIAGVIAAGMWMISTILGFQQFGMPTVLAGLCCAYAGSIFYAYRRWSDRVKAGLPGLQNTLHVKLTGAMLLVLLLDGAGYYMAVNSIPNEHKALIAALEDIFVAVALLTLTVGLVLPGVIAHSVIEVSKAADNLARGTMADFSRAMKALSEGDLEKAHVTVNIEPVKVTSRDEIGDMAASFNALQAGIADAAVGLNGAREGLSKARRDLRDVNTNLEQRVLDRTSEVVKQREDLKLEIEIRRSAEETAALFRNLIEHDATPVCILDPESDWKITFINDAGCRYFGYSREKLLTMRIPDWHPPGTLRDLSVLWRSLKKEQHLNFETTHQVADGSVLSVDLNVNLLQHGDKQYASCWIQNITERKKAEEVLRLSEEKFRQFAENINDVFWMTSVDMRTLHYVSPAFEEIWGHPTQSLYANPSLWVEAIMPEDRPLMFAAFSRLETETDISTEYRVKRPDGTVRWIHDRGFQVRDAQGKPYRKAGIAVDITERKLNAEKVSDLNKQLIVVARQSGMAEVASSVLHNAGNILNSVNVSATLVTEQIKESKLAGLIKVTELLDKHGADLPDFIRDDPRGQKLPAYLKMLSEYWRQEQAQTVEELENLNRNIQHLKDIIGAQQSLSGGSGFEEPAELSQIVDYALKMVEASFKSHGIKVARDFEKLTPSLLDKSKLLQILVNLLQNAKDALKDVPVSERRVQVTTSLSEHTCRIKVSDNGVGLRSEDFTRIFSFGFTTKPTGHGIGLHTSALSAQSMGGTLTASSAGPGLGAEFILTVPYKAIEVRA